ncbi:hypothetical protein F5878DRAFT_646345 [Lentinula raphanica]|uniref:Uncharacterized protein n=1 Tax=Lentinula raphanica TaxID=153919 RepID=A0AA38NYJ0_9AGAR|nr:hypothetical protein F5878DRAFT_646345 [Lentinula raphanica]
MPSEDSTAIESIQMQLDEFETQLASHYRRAQQSDRTSTSTDKSSIRGLFRHNLKFCSQCNDGTGNNSMNEEIQIDPTIKRMEVERMEAVSQGHQGGMQGPNTGDQVLSNQQETFEEKYKAFTKAWKESQTQLMATGQGRDTSQPLFEASVELLLKGLDICEKIGIDSLEIKWPVSRDTPTPKVEHAIALREWLGKNMPEVEEFMEPNPVVTANSTTNQPAYQPGFSQPAAIASAGANMSESYSPQFFDYETGKLSKLTRGIALDARKNMSAYLGAIERGPEVAMEIFKNRVGGKKCLTHSETNWRGKIINKRYGHLECGCPNILALVELFAKKATSCDPQYIHEADELQREMPKIFAEYKTDLSFSAANLLFERLLQPRVNRVFDTTVWAITELHGLVKEEDQALLDKICGELRPLAEKYRV